MPSPNIKLCSDAAMLSYLHRQCFTKAWSESEIRQMLDIQGTKAWVIDSKGFIIVRDLGEAEILSFGVVPDFRRKGFANSLLKQVIEALPGTTLFLEVSTANAAALALYQKHGFIATGIRKNYYSKENRLEDAIIMKRNTD